jgi:hypothetical protein
MGYYAVLTYTHIFNMIMLCPMLWQPYNHVLFDLQLTVL